MRQKKYVVKRLKLTLNTWCVNLLLEGMLVYYHVFCLYIYIWWMRIWRCEFCESAYGGQGPNELPRDVSPGTCQTQ
jgi:hypothetical protein